MAVSKRKVIKRPVRNKDLPVTGEMLDQSESRMIHRMDSGVEKLRAEIAGLRTELKSDVHSVKSELHRVALLVEEQNARNKYVLDGYAQLYELIQTRMISET